MTSSTERKPSTGLFIVAFIITAIIAAVAILHNREIAARRLAAPMPVIGNLIKAECTSYTQGGGKGGTHRKPLAVLTYEYVTPEQPARRHTFTTTYGFDTPELCPPYVASLSTSASFWYDKSNPEKASLQPYEPINLKYLYLMVLPGLFVLGGYYLRKSENAAIKRKKK